MHGSIQHSEEHPRQLRTMRNSIILVGSLLACGAAVGALAHRPGAMSLILGAQERTGTMRDNNQGSKVMPSRDQELAASAAGVEDDSGRMMGWKQVMGGGQYRGSMMSSDQMMLSGSELSQSSIGCPGRDYMRVFHSLLNAHKQIKRTYKETPEGIVSKTESDSPQVASWIQLHVEQMKELMDGCAKGACLLQPHRWDPLFAAAYKHASRIDIQATPTDKGTKVVETGTDTMSRQLVQMHAAVVSKFVENGMAEMHVSHPAPEGA